MIFATDLPTRSRCPHKVSENFAAASFGKSKLNPAIFVVDNPFGVGSFTPSGESVMLRRKNRSTFL